MYSNNFFEKRKRSQNHYGFQFSRLRNLNCNTFQNICERLIDVLLVVLMKVKTEPNKKRSRKIRLDQMERKMVCTLYNEAQSLCES